MIQLHISRALPVNSVKLELGGPGGAGGGHTEGGREAEVQLAESVLGQDAEDKKSRSEANSIDILTTLFPLHIGPIYWTNRDCYCNNIPLQIKTIASSICSDGDVMIPDGTNTVSLFEPPDPPPLDGASSGSGGSVLPGACVIIVSES